MDQTCFKCGDSSHTAESCTLKIRNPIHVIVDWTCPDCDEWFEDFEFSLNHEKYCLTLLVS